MKQITNRSGGFTLIELLTVIAIIGILASILIPVVGKVREQGRRSVCQSNIRQQLIAMHMYAEDNNNIGYWPVQSSTADDAPFYLYPKWVDDVSLFICPSTDNVVNLNRRDRQGRLIDLQDNAPGGREDSRGGHSYEYFGSYARSYNPGESTRVLKTPITTLGLETVTILLFDGDDNPRSQNCPDPTNNHGEDGSNFGFADGHVEWVPRSRINDVFEASFHGRWCP